MQTAQLFVFFKKQEKRLFGLGCGWGLRTAATPTASIKVNRWEGPGGCILKTDIWAWEKKEGASVSHAGKGILHVMHRTRVATNGASNMSGGQTAEV